MAALRRRAGAIDDPRSWVEANLAEAKGPVSAAELARLSQMKAAEVEAVLPQLVQAGAARAVPAGRAYLPDKSAAIAPKVGQASPTYVHRDALAGLCGRIMDAVKGFHAANPSRLGVPEQELAAMLGEGGDGGRDGARPGTGAMPSTALGEGHGAGVLSLAISDLLSRGELQRQGGVLVQAGREGVRLTEEDRLLCEKVESAMRSAGLAPPSPAELASALRAEESGVRRLLQLLADRGVIVRLDASIAMHRDAVEAARKVVLDLFAKAGAFETVQYRDALGVSRKYAVPLLDYFDKVHLTVRSASRRTPGAEARRLMG
jgi:selenocysteine-specific elongation factor